MVGPSRVGIGAVALALTACSPAASHPGELASRTPIPRDAFIASYAHGSGDVGGGNGDYVTAFDRVSGARIVDLLHFGPNGTSDALVGFSRQGDGSLVYLTVRPPRDASSAHGGRAAPGSGGCGGAVHRMAVDGTVTTLFEIPVTAQVGSPAVSRDGSKVAYRTTGCRPPASPTVVVPWTITVRTLADNTATSLTMPDTDLGPPTWNADGSQLAFSLSPATDLPPQATATRYVVMPADHNGAVPADRVRTLPGTDCLTPLLAFDTAGLALAQNCSNSTGSSNSTDSTSRLLQLDGTSTTVAWRAAVHPCPAERFVQVRALSADPVTGDLLVSGSAHCDGPGAVPSDFVQHWSGPHSGPTSLYLNPEAFVRDAV